MGFLEFHGEFSGPLRRVLTLLVLGFSGRLINALGFFEKVPLSSLEGSKQILNWTGTNQNQTKNTTDLNVNMKLTKQVNTDAIP